MSDLIDRQAAIDVLSLGKEILSRVLNDMYVVGTDREKYSWGLKLIEANIKDIEELPPAQPERNTGRWIYDENGMDWNLPAWVCSECHARNDNIPTVVKIGNEYKRVADPRTWQGSRFCPNCGSYNGGKQDEPDKQTD